MSNSFQIALYRDSVKKLTCGTYQGVVIKAKPILLLSVLSAIERGIVENNQIPHSNEMIEVYKQMFSKYGGNITPFFKPYYYLQFEEFWHLKWKVKEDLSIRPGLAMLRSNIEYAYFDEALWELLQDKSILNEFRSVIENYYLK